MSQKVQMVLNENFGDILIHSGIIGQRWGVRRYQNPDGSLTELGRRHYNVGKRIADSGKSSSNEASNIIDVATRLKNRSKNIDDPTKMSDDELQKRVKRMNLERQYSDLTYSQQSQGAAIAKDVLAIIGSTAAIAASTMAIIAATKGL